MSNPLRIVVAPTGAVAMVYSDAARTVMDALGHATIRRASHVEPDAAGQWVADLTPIGGPVLEPVPRRADALAAEVMWLERRLRDLAAGNLRSCA